MANRVNGKGNYFARTHASGGAATNRAVFANESPAITGKHFDYIWVRPDADCTLRVGASSKDAIALTADEAREFILKFDEIYLTCGGATNLEFVVW